MIRRGAEQATQSTAQGPVDVWRSLRVHVLRPRTVIPVGIAVAGLWLALRSLLDISAAAVWELIAAANPLLLALAVGVFYLTFPVRALRWRVLLTNVGQEQLPSPGRLIRLMVLGSFGNSISVAQLGDVFRGYLLEREAGVPLSLTIGTIVAERILDLVTLIGLMSATALAVYGGRIPRFGLDAVCGGLVFSAAGIAALALLPRSRRLVERIVPERWRATYDRFETGAVRSLRRLPLLVVYSALAWVVEGVTLWLLGLAVGVDLSTNAALFAGLVASLLSVEPVTPGGLGVTEPGIVLVLTSLGAAAAGASAVALLNRVVNYASLAVAAVIVHLVASSARNVDVRAQSPTLA